MRGTTESPQESGKNQHLELLISALREALNAQEGDIDTTQQTGIENVIAGHVPTILLVIEQLVHSKVDVWQSYDHAQALAHVQSIDASLAPMANEEVAEQAQKTAEEARELVAPLRKVYEEELGEKWETTIAILYGSLIANHPQLLTVWETQDNFTEKQARLPLRMANRLEKLYVASRQLEPPLNYIEP